LKNHKRRWKDEDVESILLNAPTTKLTEIAEQLERSEWAVYQRLKITNDKELLDEVGASELAQLFSISRRTAARWIKKRYFGKYRVAGCSLRKREGYRHVRLIQRSRLKEFAGDPINEWLLDRAGEIPQELQAQRVDRWLFYVDPAWVAERASVVRGTVHLWLREGIVPYIQTRYPARSGGPFRVIPRTIADQHIVLISDGMKSNEIKKHNTELAIKLKGFDEHVASSWRKPWDYQ